MLLSLGRRVTTGGSSYSLNGALTGAVSTICVAGAGSFSLKGNSSANPTLHGIPTTLSP